MKIAILYICTGRYGIFWDTFFTSMEKYFLSGYVKHYFVFTDNDLSKHTDRVHFIYQKHLGWPFDTLLRFHMFYGIKNQLLEFDYIFFLNANMVCVAPIDGTILPVNEQFTALSHPGYYGKERKDFPYETNVQSLAYVPIDKGRNYFMGSLNGGKALPYVKLAETLAYRIEKDLNRGIIATWHDESHLNRYLLHRRVKKLNASYGYPEDWQLPFEKRILILDKKKLGGHDFIRSKV